MLDAPNVNNAPNELEYVQSKQGQPYKKDILKQQFQNRTTVWSSGLEFARADNASQWQMCYNFGLNLPRRRSP